MYLYDDPTCATALPPPAPAGTPGYFTNGNPGSGQAATILTADFMNMLMLELVNLVQSAGLTLSKTTYNQVFTAIKAIGKQSAVLTDTGAANAYAAANSTPLVSGTLVHGVRQSVQITNANTGASTYAPDGLAAKPIYGLNLSPLQGGELPAGGVANMIYLVSAAINSGNGAWILLECTGGALQVPAATQSNQAVNLGQFAASLSGNGYTKLPNGLILQWGSVVATPSGVAVNFPIAFPNSVFAVVPGNNGATSSYIWTSYPFALSGFTIYSSATTDQSSWFAIGR